MLMAEVVLLGVAQDGGRPQPGCTKSCCIGLTSNDISYPTSLGVIESGQIHLIDVTRHLANQLQYLENRIPNYVWLTHAHFGHVDGLGLFGRETMNAQGIPLYASQKMQQLINDTPQWRIMVEQGVFVPREMSNNNKIEFGELTIEPILVPHRDELSDMHAFVISSSENKLLYLPDHDTWEETLSMYNCHDIRQWLKSLAIDIALIDGTFWSEDELQSRNQERVPHPPIKQTIEMLGYKQQWDPEIYFILLNHTNPVYDQWSEQHAQVIEMGWKIGKQGMKIKL